MCGLIAKPTPGPNYAQEFSERYLCSDNSKRDEGEAEDTAEKALQQSEQEVVEDNDCGENENDSKMQGWDWDEQDSRAQSQREDLNWATGCGLDDCWGVTDNNNSQASTIIITNEFGKGRNGHDQNTKTGQGGSVSSKNKTADLAGWAMALVGGLLHPVEAVLEVFESCLDNLDPLATAVRWVEAEV